MNLYSIPSLLSAFSFFSLGTIVLLKSKERLSIRVAFMLQCLTSFWWQFSWFILFNTKSTIWASYLVKIGYSGIIFIPVTFFHFYIAYLNKNKKWVNIYYLIAFGFLIILWATNAFINNYYTYFWGYYPKASYLHPVYLVYLTIIAIHCLYTLFLTGREIGWKGIKGNQIKYLFMALFVYTFASSDFLVNYGVEFYPLGFIFILISLGLVTYASSKYRLLNINIALTRAGIFILVYILILGIPFGLVGWGKSWLISKFGQGWFWMPMFVLLGLATLGPFLYIYLSRRAEARMRAEEHHAHELLTQASEGMMRFRSIKKLVNLIVHVTCKVLKLDNAAVFLLDEEKGEYKLEAVRLRSKYQYLGSLDNNDALIQRLSTIDDPLVYEEVKLQSQELNPVRNFTHKDSKIAISNGVKDKPDESIHDIESQMQALSAQVVIPATSRGRLLGFLVLGEKNSKRMYSQDDLSVLWALSYQAALAIENARFHQKAQEELLREDREVTSRFIGHGASHQFGNLLHRIIQRSEGKQMDLEELDLNNLTLEDAKKLILELKGEFSAISKTAFQGKDIVSGILSLGSGSPVEFKEEDLRAIITTAVSTIKLKQSKKTIQDMAQVTEIVTHITDNLPKIYCNSMQLEQVLDNLLDNDLEAIEEKDNLIKRGELKEDNFRGRISIEAGLKDDHIYLKISDNGIGIKPEDQKKVFMPFFTTKATERLSRKGHGIGMHMVKEIIKAHQGKIYIDKTEYTKGTTFVMELPLKVSENKKI